MNAAAELQRPGKLSESGIDWSRPFMPYRLTHLYHTPVWRTLTEEQQLRYTQLHALCIHEQIIFFERSFAPTVLNALLRESLPDALAAGLRTFVAEEEQHSAMFWSLNQKCAPHLYSISRYHFIQVPAAARRLIAFMTRRPRLFPMCLWMMLLQEDRALHYGRAYLRDAGVEANFRTVHKRHLADEAGHVHWDEQLLDILWPQTPGWRRLLNVGLCAWMIREFFSTPKRSGLRVIDELVRQMPELSRLKSKLCEALQDLGSDTEFKRSLYSREAVPTAWGQLDRWPECSGLRRALGDDE